LSTVTQRRLKKVLVIVTKDVADSMHVLIATGKYSRFAESDDLLVDKQDGSYVYLVTNEQAVRNGFQR